MKNTFTKGSRLCYVVAATILLSGFSLRSEAQCTYPPPVAGGASINCGQSTILTATGDGTNFLWYTQASGGNAIDTGSTFITPGLASTTTYYVETNDLQAGIQTFAYTGSQQMWTVPAGVTSITIDVKGAQGGTANMTNAIGGLGGRVRATLSVTPGEVLYFYVGGQPNNQVGGYNGGGDCVNYCGYVSNRGGGGASDIRRNGFSISNRIVVAGGGGGSGFYNTNVQHGGHGGGLTGGNGLHTGGYTSTYCGSGGSQSGGGGGPQYAGSLFSGGSSYNVNTTNSSGGGGGGYYGGGGGYYYGGAGGGSSYTDASCTSVQHTQGSNAGNGSITISYGTVTCESPRTPVTVTVNQLVTVPTVSGVSVMCGDSATLTATGSSGLYEWFTSVNSTTPVHTGSTFVTPPVSAPKTYYVRAVGSYGSPICNSAKIAVLISVTPVPLPTTASFVSIACGSAATLSVSGSSGEYNWYTQPIGGEAISHASNYTTGLLTTDTTHFYVEATSDSNAADTLAFNYTGAPQLWVVPAGVTSINVDLSGAQGGNSTYSAGGLGGRVRGKMNVTPGETLYVHVGGQPSDYNGGYNGGGSVTSSGSNSRGGGGFSDIRKNGSAPTDFYFVAGGGGGAGYYSSNSIPGGAGGDLTGGMGTSTNGSYYAYGGSQSSGGTSSYSYGGFLSGGQAYYYGSNYCGGGGGGGWYGGGGGHSGCCYYASSGGGGSSYTFGMATNVSHTQGYKSGNGQVFISYSKPSCVSPRKKVTVVTVPLSLPVAIGDTVTCADSATVSVSGSTGFFNWYKTATDNDAISHSNTVQLNGLLTDTTLYVEAVSDTLGNDSIIFNYTGSQQTWTVPAGVFSINLDVIGAQGGSNSNGTPGGFGGHVKGKLNVTPGQVLNIYVGEQPSTTTGGWNGGGSGYNSSYGRGGGGASDIRINGTTYNDRVITAGGGGGTGWNCGGNQERGGNAGSNGQAENGYYCGGYNSSYAGGGASQNTGGSGSTYWNSSTTMGQFGYGGPAYSSGSYAGGGGGGWYGGGGGSYYGGGGGGSSYANGAVIAPQYLSPVNTGHGKIIISFEKEFCASTRVPVHVIVNPVQAPSVSTNTIQCGTSTILQATSNFADVEWFTEPSGGTSFASGPLVSTAPILQTDTFYVEATSGYTIPNQVTFNYTGGVQTWTVPANVYSINVDMSGAQGGGSGGGTGGFGSRVQGQINVTPGQVLNIYVGEQPSSTTGGWNGGGNGYNSTYGRGGGGASDIRINSTSYNDRIITAGGGGGTGGGNCNQEHGGNAGGSGSASNGLTCNSYNSSYSGGGASQSAGGAGSTYWSSSGTMGQFGLGGNAYPGGNYGGGGGGGYYGGGGGSYYGGGGGGSSYAQNQVQNVVYTAGSQTGNGIVKIQYAEVRKCVSDRVPYIIFVDSLQAPVVTGSTTLCGPGGTTLNVSGGAGTYTWKNSAGTIVSTVDSLVTGTVNNTTEYYVTYNDNGCISAIATGNVTVVNLPSPAITDPGSICSSQDSIVLQSASANGIWTGTAISNASTGVFDLSSAVTGNNQVVYQITDQASGCSVSDTLQVVVNQDISASITSSAQALCISSPAVLLASQNTGGQWSGSGITNSATGQFTPSSAGNGVHPVIYSIQNGACSDADTLMLTVTAAPVAQINPAPTQLCISSAAVTLTSTMNGGTWSGMGITNAATGLYDPSSATPGNHYVYYTLSLNGCTDVDSVSINVAPAITSSIQNVSAPICVSAPVISLSGAPAGGTWSGTGVSGTTFNPSSVMAGTYDIYYTVQSGGCTATDTLTMTVLARPDANITTNNLQLCEGTAPVQVNASSTGGTWSGNGVNATGIFNPVVSGTGTHPVYYTVSNAGCSVSDSVLVSVQANPAAVITNAPSTVCPDGNGITLTATPSGGSWSGTGVNGSVFNATALNPGTYNVFYTTQNGICTSRDTLAVTVVAAPNANITTNPFQVCEGTSPVQIYTSVQGGTWSGTSVNATGLFNPATSGSGTHYAYYTRSNAGCSSTDSVQITVYTNPVATITSNASTVCSGAATIGLSATPSGGTWSGAGVSGAAFNPSTVTPGTYAVYYTVVNGICASSDTLMMQVVAEPNANITTNALQLCASSSPIQISASLGGGTWSGNGVGATGIFNPSIAGAGTHYVYYARTNAGCTSMDSVQITVSASPVANISTSPSAVCSGASTIGLSASPSGGTWSGAGVSGAAFNPSSVTPGTYAVYYTVVNGSCTSVDTLTMTVVAQPNANITTNPLQLCATSSPVQISASVAGGTWSGNGVGATGIFNPAIAGAGTHFVYYSRSNGGCTSSDSVQIIVSSSPAANISNSPAVVCSGAATISLSATPSGGAWSGAGVSGPAFNPSAVTPGTYSVYYTIGNGVCSSVDTLTMTVVAQPNANITTNTLQLCASASPVQIQVSVTGGTWSGNGVSAAGIFNPSVAGAGTHYVYYSRSNAGCTSTDSVQVNVSASPVANISNSSSAVCSGAPTILLSATPSGGTWSGAGVSGAAFNPSAVTPGTYAVYYTVSNGACTSTDTVTMTVTAQPNASITTNAMQLCESSAPVQIFAAAAGGIWSGNGVGATGIFNPSVAGAGAHYVHYTRTNAGCTSMDSVLITVISSPVANITSNPSAVCAGAATISLTATPLGGSWSGTGVSGGSFNPSSVSPGTYAITYQVQNGICSSTDAINIVVLAQPNANISTGAFQTCATSAPVQLNASVSGGIWSGNGMNANGIFNPSAAGTGTHNVYYTLTNAGCSSIDSLQVSVTASPVVTITSNPTTVCYGSPSINLSATPSGGTWSGAGIVNPVSGTFSPQLATQGIHQVYYTYSNSGCTATDDVTIEVSSVPVANFIANVECAGNGSVFTDLSSNTVGAITSWNWTFGDSQSSANQHPSHTYAAQGSYVVTLNVSTAAGCSNSATQLVQVGDAPDAQWNSTPNGNQSVDFFPIAPAVGADYLWTFGDGFSSTAVSPSHTYLATGNYAVCLTVEKDGCASTVCDTVAAFSNVGISDNSPVNLQWSAFPNPFVDYFNVEISMQSSEQVEIRLYDVSGKLVMIPSVGMMESGKQVRTIDVSAESLSTGIYTLEITIDGVRYASKMIKY